MWGDNSLWFWFTFPRWLLMLGTFSFICWPFVCLLWKNVYSVSLPFFLINLFIYLFTIIFSCVGSLFPCKGFLQLWRAGATPHCGARAPHYHGPSCCAEHRLQTRRLSSCGSRAQLLHGMWDLPRPGPEPVSPALAGRLSTTAPPGKPSFSAFLKSQIICLFVLLLCCRSSLYILD